MICQFATCKVSYDAVGGLTSNFKFLKNEAIGNFRKNERVYKKGNVIIKYSLIIGIKYLMNMNSTKIYNVTLLSMRSVKELEIHLPRRKPTDED